MEFPIKNTLDNHVLSDVTVDIQLDTDGLQMMQVISVNQIKTNETASVFVTIAKDPEQKIVISTIASFLKFRIAELSGDGKTKITEYEDEYQLEEVKDLIM